MHIADGKRYEKLARDQLLIAIDVGHRGQRHDRHVMRPRLREQILHLPASRPILDYRAQLGHVAAPRQGVREERFLRPLGMSNPFDETNPVVFVQ